MRQAGEENARDEVQCKWRTKVADLKYYGEKKNRHCKTNRFIFPLKF